MNGCASQLAVRRAGPEKCEQRSNTNSFRMGRRARLMGMLLLLLLFVTMSLRRLNKKIRKSPRAGNTCSWLEQNGKSMLKTNKIRITNTQIPSCCWGVVSAEYMCGDECHPINDMKYSALFDSMWVSSGSLLASSTSRAANVSRGCQNARIDGVSRLGRMAFNHLRSERITRRCLVGRATNQKSQRQN